MSSLTRRSLALSSALMISLGARVAAAAPEPGGDPPPPAPTTTDPEQPTDGPAPADVAKAADLTPIVPSPHDVTRPAFQLYAEIDLPVLAVGLVFGGSRLIQTQKAYCAPLCDAGDLNFLDRKTAGYYSTGWQLASNVGIYSLIGGSAALLIGDVGFLPAVNDGVVIAESGATAVALTTLMTMAAGRPRPFLFGEKAPLAERNSADAGMSFLSSHTSMSFAIATSVYMTAHRLHPRSRMPKIVLGVGLAGASFVALSRVMGGKHFITDALGGAVVGSAVGILVPALHRSPVRVVPTVNAKEPGLALAGEF
jgi:membrane-associated phospholipid phosphatase